MTPYVDPDYWALEKAHIFKKVWLHVGRVEEIARVGDDVVREIPAADASVIVARNRQKGLSAFHTVSSHRWNKVGDQP